MIAFCRDLIFKDFWLKLFSLALAVLFWLTVSFAIPISPLAKAIERPFENLPVIVMSSASDVRSFRVNPAQVEVIIQGDPRILQGLEPKDIHVQVDLTDIEPVVGIVRKRIQVSTPAGVTHVRVIPDDVLIISPGKS